MDSCVQFSTLFADMYDTYTSDCKVFNKVSFKKLNLYNYKEFYQKWKERKSEISSK